MTSGRTSDYQVALTTADRLEILDLLARCAWAQDAGDTAAWLDSYTADATLLGAIGQPSRLSGHAELATTMAGRAPVDGRHWMSDHVLDEEQPGQVRHRCYWNFFMFGGGPPRLFAMGTYTDLLVRRDDRWQISERTISLEAVASLSP